jgi:hypothetical protein
MNSRQVFFVRLTCRLQDCHGVDTNLVTIIARQRWPHRFYELPTLVLIRHSGYVCFAEYCDDEIDNRGCCTTPVSTLNSASVSKVLALVDGGGGGLSSSSSAT